MTDADTAMVDVAFAVAGDAPPREHRRALAAALEARLPWLAELPGCGVHRLNTTAEGGPPAVLSQRARLVLRVPCARAGAAAALEGVRLQLGPATLHVGAMQVRELRPWGTLYAHLVAAAAGGDERGDPGADELAFLRAVDDELAALGVAGRPICGRLQVLASDALRGYGLMLDRLSAADSLRLLQAGLGPHRRLGCGLFVPHRSAAAVGSPP